MEFVRSSPIQLSEAAFIWLSYFFSIISITHLSQKRYGWIGFSIYFSIVSWMQTRSRVDTREYIPIYLIRSNTNLSLPLYGTHWYNYFISFLSDYLLEVNVFVRRWNVIRSRWDFMRAEVCRSERDELERECSFALLAVAMEVCLVIETTEINTSSCAVQGIPNRFWSCLYRHSISYPNPVRIAATQRSRPPEAIMTPGTNLRCGEFCNFFAKNQTNSILLERLTATEEIGLGIFESDDSNMMR